MDREEFEKNLLLDPLWQLEYASSQLDSDIVFLHCIDDEYFEKGEEKGEGWLKWQMRNILQTLRKSIELTQMQMKTSINAIYAEKRSKNSM